MEWIGLAVFLVLVFGGTSILASYNKKKAFDHMQSIINALPENERSDFVKKYLENPNEQLEKFTKD